jgi:hypothetical protein
VGKLNLTRQSLLGASPPPKAATALKISPTASPATGNPILRILLIPSSALLSCAGNVLAELIAEKVLAAAPIDWFRPCDELNRPIFGSPDTLFI